MRKVDEGGKQEKEKNGENSGPLTSLPVDRLNVDRLQRRRSWTELIILEEGGGRVTYG